MLTRVDNTQPDLPIVSGLVIILPDWEGPDQTGARQTWQSKMTGFIQSPQARSHGVCLDQMSCFQQWLVWQDYFFFTKRGSILDRRRGCLYHKTCCTRKRSQSHGGSLVRRSARLVLLFSQAMQMIFAACASWVQLQAVELFFIFRADSGNRILKDRFVVAEYICLIIQGHTHHLKFVMEILDLVFQNIRSCQALVVGNPFGSI